MIKLTLTEEQASIVARACEFYARVKMGQFNEILWNCLSASKVEDYCERRDRAEMMLLEARNAIYPELHGIGHSYGMGRFEDADKSYDVYQVIRYVMGGKEPFSYYDLPKCEEE